METYLKIVFVMTLQFMIISGLWAVDIGTSALVSQNSFPDAQFKTQGLLFTRDANTQYHLGLALVYLSFFILSCIYIYSILNEKKRQC